MGRLSEPSAPVSLSSSTSMVSRATMSPIRDGEFYSPDVVFLVSFFLSSSNCPPIHRDIQVEGVLFKVPRRPFEQDSAFGDTFNLPPLDGTTEEGTSDEHPLPLHGIKEAEFRALLSVMFRT